MKRRGTREQGKKGPEHIVVLLREAMPPVEVHVDGTHDLWPAMQHRLRTEAAAKPPGIRVPWFDWALAGGLVLLLAAFPSWIPVLLYYL